LCLSTLSYSSMFRELNHCTASIRFIYQNAWFS
jgi:hypothetical protein